MLHTETQIGCTGDRRALRIVKGAGPMASISESTEGNLLLYERADW